MNDDDDTIVDLGQTACLSLTEIVGVLIGHAAEMNVGSFSIAEPSGGLVLVIAPRNKARSLAVLKALKEFMIANGEDVAGVLDDPFRELESTGCE